MFNLILIPFKIIIWPIRALAKVVTVFGMAILLSVIGCGVMIYYNVETQYNALGCIAIFILSIIAGFSDD